jgi:hypothetical protein
MKNQVSYINFPDIYVHALTTLQVFLLSSWESSYTISFKLLQLLLPGTDNGESWNLTLASIVFIIE